MRAQGRGSARKGLGASARDVLCSSVARRRSAGGVGHGSAVPAPPASWRAAPQRLWKQRCSLCAAQHTHRTPWLASEVWQSAKRSSCTPLAAAARHALAMASCSLRPGTALVAGRTRARAHGHRRRRTQVRAFRMFEKKMRTISADALTQTSLLSPLREAHWLARMPALMVIPKPWQ